MSDSIRELLINEQKLTICDYNLDITEYDIW